MGKRPEVVEDLFQDILRVLGHRFDFAFLSDAALMESIPDGSFISLQLELPADVAAPVQKMIADFNKWSMSLADRQRDPGQEVAAVVCRMRPLVVAAAEELTTPIVRQSCDTFALYPA